VKKVINPKDLKAFLFLKQENLLIKPRKQKESTERTLATNVSDKEASTIQALQDYLFDWHYIPENSFESAMFYLINLAGSLHKRMVEYETKMGRAYDPENPGAKTNKNN
jgi:hypothetical protein